jgi:hypothetical protein
MVSKKGTEVAIIPVNASGTANFNRGYISFLMIE